MKISPSTPYSLTPNKYAFIDRYLEPLRTDTINVETRKCPICQVRYGEESLYGHREEPCRIKIPGCNHVFGYRCLEILIDTDETFGNKCPLCRTEWFFIKEDKNQLRDGQRDSCIQKPSDTQVAQRRDTGLQSARAAIGRRVARLGRGISTQLPFFVAEYLVQSPYAQKRD